MRVMLAIPSLRPGGAETQFVHLANGLAKRGYSVTCVIFSPGDERGNGVNGPRLVNLGKRSRADNLAVLARLAHIAQETAPDVYYGFLSLPNIFGALLKILRPRLRLVFGLRASNMDMTRYGLAARTSTALERQFSRLASLVICNSAAGKTHATHLGYTPDTLRSIPNGIDTGRCHQERSLGAPLREQWGIAADQLLVGLVARLDPMKDHPTFLEAVAILATQRPDARFVCVGGGPEGYAQKLREMTEDLGLGQRVVWAGTRTDMPAVYNALDLLCLTSRFGEGFPNVLGEAMACGVPCVTTDVGDAALVVGKLGVVVPSQNPQALADGILTQLDRMERENKALRRACREHIVLNFSVERMVTETEKILLSLCGGRG